jgi:hypothetical protein
MRLRISTEMACFQIGIVVCGAVRRVAEGCVAL